VRFLYFSRLPSGNVRGFFRFGFSLREIFSQPDKPLLRGTKNMFLINLFDPWPYFVFEKNETGIAQ
jgi:hypothetical protein